MKKLLALLLTLALLLSGCSVEIVLAPEETAPAQTISPTTGSEDLLTVHFIDVGQADAILIECAGQFMLIDGGNREDGQKVVSYLQSCGVEKLEAVICTHAHEDHVGGLPAVLAVYPTAAVYAPTKTYSSKIFDDFLYYTDQQRLEVTIPAPGDSLKLGSAELLILGPVESYAETNDTSIVVKLTHGESTFLLTGDMEVAAENDMLDYWEDRMDWNVDILKSGHHGSSTSSGYRFLYETDPEYIVISVGEGNTYGHPHEEVISRYKDAGIPMFRTDELGTVLAVSDGNEITITWEKQNAAPEDIAPAEGEGIVFIGNKNSKTLHGPGCGSLPKEENRVYFDSYQEAIDAGYKPCGSCLG